MRKRSALGDDAAWVFLPRGEKMLPPGPPEKRCSSAAPKRSKGRVFWVAAPAAPATAALTKTEYK